MATLFAFLFIVSVIGLIVGLIKLNWVVKWGEKKQGLGCCYIMV